MNPPRDFSGRVSRGALWVTATSICARGLNLISAVFLARILAPSDFGLMAVAMAVISFSQATTQMGFQSALIQKQQDTDQYLNVAWTLDLIKFLVLALFVILAAPLLAKFFNAPGMAPVLRALSLTFIFQGLRNMGVIYFRKHLEFHRQFILETVPLLAYIIIVLVLALILGNVWALVWAAVANSAVYCILSYIMSPIRPRIQFHWAKGMELFHFGKWILADSLLIMAKDQGITMLTGKWFGMTALGFYNRANAFSTMIFQQVSEITWKVGYPAYSWVQSDTIQLKQAYLHTLRILTFMGFPMAFGLYAISYDFTLVLLTEKWLPIVPIIQLMCGQAILEFMNVPATIAFPASGAPKTVARIHTLRIGWLAILIYPLAHLWQLRGVVAALVISALLSYPILWYLANRLVKCPVRQFFSPILYPLLNSMIMVAGIRLIRPWIPVPMDGIGLTTQILSAMAIYGATTGIIYKFLGDPTVELLWKICGNLKRNRRVE